MVKNPPSNTGDAGDVGSIPGSSRSSAGGNGSPLQYSCLGHPMDSGAWQAVVHAGHKSSDANERLTLSPFILEEPGKGL